MLFLSLAECVLWHSQQLGLQSAISHKCCQLAFFMPVPRLRNSKRLCLAVGSLCRVQVHAIQAFELTALINNSITLVREIWLSQELKALKYVTCHRDMKWWMYLACKMPHTERTVWKCGSGREGQQNEAGFPFSKMKEKWSIRHQGLQWQKRKNSFSRVTWGYAYFWYSNICPTSFSEAVRHPRKNRDYCTGKKSLIQNP